ncbi:Exopolyphosphatase [Ceratobasidium sp. UAMH 11750]|nr:Exopolyphosphatase [Ceratobasidium sp. UAMH 11750]
MGSLYLDHYRDRLLVQYEPLSAFLVNNKQLFLADVSSNQGESWTIVMGNEAGGKSSFSPPLLLQIQHPHHRPYLNASCRPGSPPENLLAFQLAHLDPNHNDLLTLDDITSSTPLSNLRTSFALIDHNRLLPKFITKGADRVTAIFGHHEDEKQHTNANPRIIGTTGSCASIIGSHFQGRFPSNEAITDVASLLLSAILIDTNGLKKKEDGGKADATDLASSKSLYPLSRFGTISTTDQSSTESKTIPDLTEILSQAKLAVSHLSGRDLLRRDYKEYEFGSPTTGNFTRTLYRPYEPGRLDRTRWKKQKHKREMLVVFPSAEGAVSDTPTGLEKKLYESIEANEVLDAQRRDLEGIEGRRARAWEQKNKKATRKQVAPAIKAIIEGGW